MSLPLLVLRPQPGAEATAGRARALGLDPVVVPLFHVKPVLWEPPDAGAYDVVLMTSANAARHGGHKLNDYTHKRLLAVGGATAAAAKAVGFKDVSVGSGDAAAVLATLSKELRVLHLAGRDHVGSDRVDSVVVYEAEALDAPELPASAIVLVHSPRAASRLAQLIERKGGFALVPISDAAAAAAGPGWGTVRIAQAPRDEAMLELARQLCDWQPE